MKWILILLFPLQVYALPVIHTHKPHFNFTQILSQDSCSSFNKRRDSVGCNPALLELNNDEGLTLYISGKSDGDSIDNGQKLVFEKIEKEYLEDLMQENNFLSYEGGGFLEFKTPYFYLSYDPLHVTTDVYIYNPAYPEVSMSLHNTKRLNLSSGLKLNALSSKQHSFFIGADVYYNEHNYYQDKFSLFQLTNGDVDDLIDFESTNNIQSDMYFTFLPESDYIPLTTVILRNVNSEYSLDEDKANSEVYFQPVLIYETYSKVNVGWNFDFVFGSFNAEFTMPFDSYFKSYYTDYSTMAFSYSLGNFNMTTSFSKHITIGGFKFESNSSSIGIYYSRQKNLGNYLERVEEAAGFSLEVYL